MASANEAKIKEVREIVPQNVKIVAMSELGLDEEIPETGETLESNALIKVRYLHDKLNCNCFAEDSGLEVYSLNFEPGVYSARYAGTHKSSKDNIELLLSNLKSHKDRSARFRTVLALILEGHEYLFEGVVEGSIVLENKGTGGFGYDPVFVPFGYRQTFAEMESQQKNQISHRGIAVRKFIDFLFNYKT